MGDITVNCDCSQLKKELSEVEETLDRINAKLNAISAKETAIKPRFKGFNNPMVVGKLKYLLNENWITQKEYDELVDCYSYETRSHVD